MWRRIPLRALRAPRALGVSVVPQVPRVPVVPRVPQVPRVHVMPRALGVAPSPVKRSLSTESMPKITTVARVGAHQLAQRLRRVSFLDIVMFIVFGPFILASAGFLLTLPFHYILYLAEFSFNSWCWLLEILGIFKG